VGLPNAAPRGGAGRSRRAARSWPATDPSSRLGSIRDEARHSVEASTRRCCPLMLRSCRFELGRTVSYLIATNGSGRGLEPRTSSPSQRRLSERLDDISLSCNLRISLREVSVDERWSLRAQIAAGQSQAPLRCHAPLPTTSIPVRDHITRLHSPAAADSWVSTADRTPTGRRITTPELLSRLLLLSRGTRPRATPEPGGLRSKRARPAGSLRRPRARETIDARCASADAAAICRAPALSPRSQRRQAVTVIVFGAGVGR
jgi:hypothetical protein